MKALDTNSLLLEQLKALLEPSDSLLSISGNITALLYNYFEQLNWLGFYYVDKTEEILRLGPFQGKIACTTIPFGNGVCGSAWKEDLTQVVNDVHQFPGHIACDSASESEIVIPIHYQGKVIAVLDIDSPIKNRFTEQDKELLERIVEVIENFLEENEELIQKIY